MRYIPAEDLPYGPGNPDYEYDDWRQRELDEKEESDGLGSAGSS